MTYRDGAPALPKPAKRRRNPAAAIAHRVHARDWVSLLPDLLRAALPEPLRDFRVRGPRHSLIGFYYGADERIHYEVWVQPRTGMLEVGLHFEAEPERNLALLEALAAHIEAIMAALGPRVEGEQWTKRWTRLHETRPLEPLSTDYAGRIAARVAQYIRALEPLLRVQRGAQDRVRPHQPPPVTRRAPTVSAVRPS